jgi:hypothetical protein
VHTRALALRRTRSCTKCAQGRYAIAAGATTPGTCAVCPHGQYSGRGTGICRTCPAGKFSDWELFSSKETIALIDDETSKTLGGAGAGGGTGGKVVAGCITCPSGKYTPLEGQHKCTACAAGKADTATGTAAGGVDTVPLERAASAAKDGRATQYPDLMHGLPPCLPCQPGYYAPLPGGRTCDSCRRGSFQPAAGQRSCTACAAGRFGAGERQVNKGRACVACPSGKYTALPGASACLACVGGVKLAAGQQKPGVVYCWGCPKGKFEIGGGSRECADCPKDKYSAAEQGSGKKCLDCLVANLPFTGGKVDSLRFFWTAGLAGQHKCVKKPLDCNAGEWGAYSGCSRSCGGGLRTRKREIKWQSWGGGEDCAERGLAQTQLCAGFCCPVDCQDMPWGEWQSCSRTCGGGTQIRVRKPPPSPSSGSAADASSFSPFMSRRLRGAVTAASWSLGGSLRNAHCGGKECSAGIALKQCSNVACATDCQVSRWGGWDACTKTCGAGTRVRRRRVDTKAQHGGKHCPPTTDRMPCSEQCCPGFFMLSADDFTTCKACPAGRFLNPAPQLPDARAHNLSQSKVWKEGAGALMALQCTQCPLGKFQEQSAQLGCKQCVDSGGVEDARPGASSKGLCPKGCPCGFFSTHAADGAEHGSRKFTCTRCPAGQYLPVKNSQAATTANQCRMPPAGFQPNEARCAVLPCGRGHAQSPFDEDDPRSRLCLACASGQFSDSEDALECKECAPGQFSAKASSRCVGCAVGQHATANVWEFDVHASAADMRGSGCKKCPAGQYMPVPSSSSSFGKSNASSSSSSSSSEDAPAPAVADSATAYDCFWCPVGKFQTMAGRTSCHACVAGRFGDEPFEVASYKGCKDCPRGRYQAAPAGSRCHSCPAGRATELTGATTRSMCVQGLSRKFCSPGQFNDETLGQCMACPIGKYQNSHGRSHCDLCSVGRYSQRTGIVEAHECFVCPGGKYAPIEGLATCMSCPAGRHRPAPAEAYHCVPCPAGRFQRRDGSTQCLLCPAGKHSIRKWAMRHFCKVGLSFAFTTSFTALHCAARSRAHPLPCPLTNAPLRPVLHARRRPPGLLDEKPGRPVPLLAAAHGLRSGRLGAVDELHEDVPRRGAADGRGRRAAPHTQAEAAAPVRAPGRPGPPLEGMQAGVGRRRGVRRAADAGEAAVRVSAFSLRTL